MSTPSSPGSAEPNDAGRTARGQLRYGLGLHSRSRPALPRFGDLATTTTVPRPLPPPPSAIPRPRPPPPRVGLGSRLVSSLSLRPAASGIPRLRSPSSHLGDPPTLTATLQPRPPDHANTLNRRPNSRQPSMTNYSAGPSAVGAISSSINPGTLPRACRGPSTHSKLKDAGKIAWTRLEMALRVLEKGTGVFPPLKSAVSEFNSCLHIVKAAAENSGNYEELTSELNAMVDTLNQYANELSSEDLSGSIANITLLIQKEAERIKEKTERGRTSRVLESAQDQEDVMQCYRRIEAAFRKLQNNVSLRTLRNTNKQLELILLQGMSPEEDARYNSNYSTTIRRRGCTAETRKNVHAEIQAWVRDPNAAKVYWMNGMAGTGKTTIAYTLCERLEANKQLGANFFCSRTKESCRDVGRIVPTIACQLARYSPAFRSALCKVLESDQGVSKLNVAQQFEKLVKEPLMEVESTIPDGVVVVIDALDECEDNHGVRLVLATLMRFVRGLPVKFFVASRPEPAVLEKMQSSSDYSPAILRLHDIEESIVEEDIKKYLVEALDSMSPPPAQAQIEQLAKRAGKLFIYAATAVRYILPDHGSAHSTSRLNAMISTSPLPTNRAGSTKKYEELDSLYATILAAAFNTRILEDSEIKAMQLVLWTVVCAKEPMTVNAIASLLDLTEQQVFSALQPLRSVLHVSDNSQLISALHTSFPDYMLEKSRSGPYYCDQTMHSQLLTNRCFDVMKDQLRFNICNLESSFLFDRDVPALGSRIEKAISPALFYACRYWGDHLRLSDVSAMLSGKLVAFLSYRLLFWMEVLNLKQSIVMGEPILLQAREWLLAKHAPDDNIKQQVSDAQAFVTRFSASPCTRSTPHIYISALPLCPRISSVYAHYWGRTKGLMNVHGTAISRRAQAAIATWVTKSKIKVVAFSPDGSHIACGLEDGTIRVWNTHTGDIFNSLFKGHTGSVNCVAFSLDSTRIVSGSDDRTIRVWDTQTGYPIAAPFKGHTGSVNSVAFSPNGTCLVSGSSDGTIQVWDTRTGDVIAGPFAEQSDVVNSIAFCPDGTRIVSGSADGTVRVWDAQSGTIIAGPIKGHVWSVNCVTFSPDGKHIVSGSRDSIIRVWDAQTGDADAEPFKGQADDAESVAFPPDGTRVVSGSDDGTIRVWNAGTGEVLAGPFAEHSDRVNSVAFSPDGTRVVSGSADRTIRVWDARASDSVTGLFQKQTSQIEPIVSSRNNIAGMFKGHTDSINSVAFSPDGTQIISGSADRTVRVWDASSGDPVAGLLEGGTSSVNSIAFSPEGTHIASGLEDGTIRVWHTQFGTTQERLFKGHRGSVNCISYSLDSTRIVSGSDDCTIRVWDTRAGGSVAVPFRGHTGPVNSVVVSPDGTIIVSGSHDCTIRVWDLVTGDTIAGPLKGHKWSVNSVAFSPDGSRFVSGSRDGIMRVWGAQTGDSIAGPFKGHDWSVNTVAFSPDGTRIVSGSYDCTISVWDAWTGEAVAGPFPGHSSPVNSVAFSPDGARIVSGSDDRTIRVWNVRTRVMTHDQETDLIRRPDSIRSSNDDWDFSDDGWVNLNDGMFVWISPDLQNLLPSPSHPLVIGPQGSIQIEGWDLFLGENWSLCYNSQGS